MRQIIIGLFLLVPILWSSTASARGGVFVNFGLGYAMTDGEDYVYLQDIHDNCMGSSSTEYCEDRVHTDGGEGPAFQFGLGYNFYGYVGLEANLAIHGNSSSGGNKEEGGGHISGLLRVYPLQFLAIITDGMNLPFDEAAIKASWWEPSVYFGAGRSWMGYHLVYDINHKARGWDGMSWSFGASSDFYLTKNVSIGADLRFIVPKYDRFIEDWGKRFTKPENWDAPENLVFAPMLTLTFHFADPNPEEGVDPIVK